MTRKIAFAVVLLLSALAFGRQYAGYISGDGVQIRAQGANFYERLGEFSRDAEVKVLSEKDGWCEVELPETVKLWIEDEYLDGNGVVNSDAAYLYAGQSTRFTKVRRLDAGIKLVVAGSAVNKMIPVYAPAGTTGWVSAQYVSDKPSEPILVIADNTAAIAAERKALEEAREREQKALEEERAQLERTREELARMQEQSRKEMEELERQKEEVGRIAETKQATMEKLTNEQSATEELSRQLDEVSSENEELNNRIAEERRKQEEYRQRVEEAQVEAASLQQEAENLQSAVTETVETATAEAVAAGEVEKADTVEAVDDAEKTGNDGHVVLIAREAAPAEDAPVDVAAQEAAAPSEPEIVSCTGIVVPLGVRSTREASYALCRLEDNKYLPIYYLSSKQLKMSKWDRQIVTVTGRVKESSDSKYPLLVVQGILKVR